MPYRHLYVHVPFCARRCAYCDFAIAVRRETPVDDYLDALGRELAIRVPAGTTEVPLDTLYLGGGTPSRLGGDGIARAVDLVRRHFAITDGAEVTIEANPEDVSVESARRWRDAGVNRVSLGVQSFDAAVLQWMHRTHTATDPLRAAEALCSAGLDDWSLDLIYALPAEIPRDWEADLASALALRPTHISAYGLTVEIGTPLARWAARGEVSETDEERYERDFLVTHEVLSGGGYRHYEVSNYALPGRVARHNSAYWRAVPYLGAGPAAHGFDGATRRWNTRDYTEWRRLLLAGVDPIGGEERLTEEQGELEGVYIGLRTMAGVPVMGSELALVAPWVAAGWGVLSDGVLSLTPLGWLRLDALVAALTDHRSRL